jgi:hypothetical protein
MKNVLPFPLSTAKLIGDDFDADLTDPTIPSYL